jgi:Ca2+-binding EF-hand superfamily protein
MINFVVSIDNEDAIIRCFHLIDSEGDGVITVKELVQAMVEFMDRPLKLAENDAKEIMKKIDFNLSDDISYSGTLTPTKSS